MTFAIWITGVSGSGKSTIAKELAKKIDAEVLRLDEIRRVITPKPSYKIEEKNLVYRALAYLGFKLGKNIIFDSVDETGEGRKTAKELIKNLLIVQLKCPQEICEKREINRKDKVGMIDLYKRAKQGKIRIAGLNAPYAEEDNPDILVDTEKTKPKESANIIYGKIKSLGWY